MAPSQLTPLLAVFDEALLDAVLTKLSSQSPSPTAGAGPHSPDVSTSGSRRSRNLVDSEYRTVRLPLDRHDVRSCTGPCPPSFISRPGAAAHLPRAPPCIYSSPSPAFPQDGIQPGTPIEALQQRGSTLENQVAERPPHGVAATPLAVRACNPTQQGKTVIAPPFQSR